MGLVPCLRHSPVFVLTAGASGDHSLRVTVQDATELPLGTSSLKPACRADFHSALWLLDHIKFIGNGDHSGAI